MPQGGEYPTHFHYSDLWRAWPEARNATSNDEYVKEWIKRDRREKNILFLRMATLDGW